MALAEHRRGYVQGATGTGGCVAKPGGSGEKGSKRHLLVDGRGVPLSLVITGANTHDATLTIA